MIRAGARAWAALLLGALLVLLGAQSASAHAELLETDPAEGSELSLPPAEGVLTFNEAVQLIDGSIRLFPGDGDPVILDAHVSDTSVIAVFPADLDDGRYALSYRVVSADGHPVSGAVTFTIGDGGGAAPVVETETPADTRFALGVLTAMQYLALLTFSGLILFSRVVLRAPAQGRSRAALRLCGGAAVLASILLVPLSALNVAGLSLPALIDPAAWGAGVLWAPFAAAVIVVVAVPAAARLTRSALGTVLALVAVSAPVLVGHTQLLEPRALIVAADIGHLLAGSVWVGGVLGLLLVLDGRDGGAADPAAAVRVVQRFSRLAVWSVAILAVSGMIMGVMIVGSVDALFRTAYGLTLLLKIGVVTAVLALAAYNRIGLLPRISTQPTIRMQWGLLRRTLGYEAGLLAAVLAVTGALTNLSPGHDHHGGAEQDVAAQASSLDAQAQGLSLRGTLEPAQRGENSITFTLEYEGEPIAPADVTIRSRLPEHDLGPLQTVPELDPSTGTYSALVDLPVAGEWQIQVLARVSTFAEPIVTIPIEVR